MSDKQTIRAYFTSYAFFFLQFGEVKCRCLAESRNLTSYQLMFGNPECGILDSEKKNLNSDKNALPGSHQKCRTSSQWCPRNHPNYLWDVR